MKKLLIISGLLFLSIFLTACSKDSNNSSSDINSLTGDEYKRSDDFATTRPASTGDKDCPDFDTQQEAQDFFESEGGPDEDYYNLDRDGDGVACETLP